MEGRLFPERVARLGEYFSPAEPVGCGWRPLTELLDDDALADVAEATRRAMAGYAGTAVADVPARVATSSLQLSIASRLLSPLVGCFATGAGVPLLTADVLRWRRVAHTVHFAVDAVDWADARDSAVAAEAIDVSLLSTVLEPLVDQLHSATALSRTVMWGNVISAAHGAVTVMGLADTGLVPAGTDLVRSMALRPRLRGTATMSAPGFRRRSCCLFYLAPNGGLCGDCVLHDAPGSH